MTAHDLYTLTLSDYKSCLCSSPALTLRSYCRERHVNYHGMCLWLSRHGISIRELRPSSSVAEDVLSEIFLLTSSLRHPKRPDSRKAASMTYVRGSAS